MPLLLDNLRSAIETLGNSIAVSENVERMAQASDAERDVIRAGVIQHFEMTYMMCMGLIDRWLKDNVGPNATRDTTRRDIYRLAARYGIIPDAEAWKRHHDARNDTSHIYNRERALLVYRAALEFMHDARRLLETLERLND